MPRALIGAALWGRAALSLSWRFCAPVGGDLLAPGGNPRRGFLRSAGRLPLLLPHASRRFFFNHSITHSLNHTLLPSSPSSFARRPPPPFFCRPVLHPRFSVLPLIPRRSLLRPRFATPTASVRTRAAGCAATAVTVRPLPSGWSLPSGFSFPASGLSLAPRYVAADRSSS
ncbi:MAG: hypothetical protein [Microviridae sp.]|nr:MAG: hypothetical protein [Microviridae sp.]